MNEKQKEALKKLILEAETVAHNLADLFEDVEGDAGENEDELLSGIAAQIEQALEDFCEAIDPLKQLCK